MSILGGAAVALAGAALFLAHAARAQFSQPAPGTQVHDPTPLKPPPGARVAIVEWEDMECPDCGRANPLLKEAAAKYNIPWIRHDFPLAFHAWSFNAAVNAIHATLKALRDGKPSWELPNISPPSDLLKQATRAADYAAWTKDFLDASAKA